MHSKIDRSGSTKSGANTSKSTMNIDREQQLYIILTMHFIAFTTVFLIVMYFLNFEYNKYAQNWNRVFQNKFVKVTMIGSTTVLVNSVLYFEYLFTHYGYLWYRLNAEQEAGLLFACSFIVLVAAFAHVTLLFLRTKGLFETNKLLMNFMKIMIISFLVCSTLAMVTGIAVLIPNPMYSAWRFAFTMFSGLYGISLSLVDAVTSISFALYVKNVGKGLKSQRFADKTTRSTWIVAQFGMVLSITSLGTVVIYIIERNLSDEMTQEWLFAFIIWGVSFVSILWTVMKIQLDKLTEDVEVQQVKMSHTADSQLDMMRMGSPNASISQPLMEIPEIPNESLDQEHPMRFPDLSLSQPVDIEKPTSSRRVS
jgi:hypothetical protein